MFCLQSSGGRAWSGIAATVLLGMMGSVCHGAFSPQQRVPLYLFWNGIDDNYSSVNTSVPGYERVRIEANILKATWPGAVPLKLYFHAGRYDYFLTATPESENSAKQAGYTWVRDEGFVFQNSIAGTVPLKTYWNAARGDHANVASAVSESDQQKSGYTYLRTEGYVFAATDTDFGVDKLTIETFETPAVLKDEIAWKTSFVVHPDTAGSGCRYSWIGTVLMDNPHDVVLTICDTGVVGRVQVAGRTFEVNPRRMKKEDIFEYRTPPTAASAKHGPTIDIAIGYTPRVLAKNTNELNLLTKNAVVPAMTAAAYMKANLQLAVDHLNAILGASGVPATAQLANTQQFPRIMEESFNSVEDALERIAPRGFLPCGSGDDPYRVKSYRDFVGADLVSIWLDDSLMGASDGRGYVSEHSYYCDQLNGYNVLKAGSAFQKLTFAHEIGHNLGALHGAGDPDYADPFQQPAYAHGYTDAVGAFYTIMSSNRGCPTDPTIYCPRVPYYSNPRIKLDSTTKGWNLKGRPAGNAGPADNARRLREEVGPVSSYKSLRCPGSTSGCSYDGGGGPPSDTNPDDPPIVVK